MKAQKVLFLFLISHLLDIFIIQCRLYSLISEKLMRYDLGDQYDIANSLLYYYIFPYRIILISSTTKICLDTSFDNPFAQFLITTEQYSPTVSSSHQLLSNILCHYPQNHFSLDTHCKFNKMTIHPPNFTKTSRSHVFL